MRERLRFLVNRLRERLWVKPVAACALSVAGVFLAKTADGTGLGDIVPEISIESISVLLSIMASGMLVIATFAVASMVAAYASASSTATPRSFSLVIADDVSQTALSSFVGAFIFSIVALTAVQNEYFETAGRFVLFSATVAVFGIVVFTFVRWVDRIARLGRLGDVIDTVEKAAASALKRRRGAPTLRAAATGSGPVLGRAIYPPAVGYVQRIDVSALQRYAEKIESRVVVAVLPGAFVVPDRPLAFVVGGPRREESKEAAQVAQAFQIGGGRLFDDDPRFGLLALSEIASRALSPAVNDPGTAIAILGTLTRLFVLWAAPAEEEVDPAPVYDAVEVPELSVDDMFDDAFMAIARDGAGKVEVMIRLQKALAALHATGNDAMREAAVRQSRLAMERAERALPLRSDVAAVHDAGRFALPQAGG